MGNHRFRISDMVSSSWFHRLKGMSRANRRQRFNTSTKKSQTSSKAIASSEVLLPIQHPKHQDLLPGRSSNYIPTKERREKSHCSPLNTKASDTHFPLELPKKSKKKSVKPCSNLVSSVSCNCALTSVFKSHSSGELTSFDDCNDPCNPIITTSARFDRPATEENKLPPAKKEARMQRSAVSENFVVIKSSANPMRDFMESVLEMIVENGIDEPSDLEELLACYLTLNSEEYHEVIIRVFEHILVCSD